MSEERLCVLVNMDEALALLESRADDLSFYAEGLKEDAHEVSQKLIEEIHDEDLEALKLGIERLRHVGFTTKDLLEGITKTLEKEKDVSER